MRNMVFVQGGGTFEMSDICLKKYGVPCTFANEHASFPVYTVRLDSFYIAKYKVTYMDYHLYTNNKGLPELKVDAGYLEDYPKLRDSNLPATADWQLSRDYCQWLGEKTGYPLIYRPKLSGNMRPVTEVRIFATELMMVISE